MMIWVPVIVKREVMQTEPQPKEPFRLAGFRTAYVFDESQTEGKPFPEFAGTTLDRKGHADRLTREIAAWRLADLHRRNIAG